MTAASVLVTLALAASPPLDAELPLRPLDAQAGSVYRLSQVVDGLVIGLSSLAIILPSAYASSLVRARCPCSPNEVNAFDRHVIGNSSAFAGTLSDVSQLTAIVAPVLLDYADVGFHHELLEDTVVYAEALTVSGAVLTLTKYAVQRPRPYAYAAGTSSGRLSSAAYTSFYSGHTAIAFTALTAGSMTLTLRHGPRLWPWVTTALLGTSIAVERVLAGQHFYSDVIFAAVAGVGVGVLVPMLHARVGPVLSHLAVSPRPSGVEISWSQAF